MCCANPPSVSWAPQATNSLGVQTVAVPTPRLPCSQSLVQSLYLRQARDKKCYVNDCEFGLYAVVVALPHTHTPGRRGKGAMAQSQKDQRQAPTPSLSCFVCCWQFCLQNVYPPGSSVKSALFARSSSSIKSVSSFER